MIVKHIFIVIVALYLSGCWSEIVFVSSVSDTDYSILNEKTVTPTDGSNTAIETDSSNNDVAFEVDESSIITLSDSYTLASPSAGSGYSGDWELSSPAISATVTLTASVSSLAENSGTTVTLTATSSTTSTSDITVTLATTGTATDSTDYSAVNGTTITISAGATTGTKTFTITDDSLSEGDETIIIAISSVSNATENGNQSVTVTITDNESPTVTLAASVSSLAENSGTTVTLTATSSTTSTSAITVTLATTGTATDGNDYSAVNGTTITISAGATTGTKTFTITDDSIYENDETVIAAISSVTNATESGTQSVTVTITENESSPTVQISSSAASVYDHGSSLTITATSSQAADEAISVVIGTSGTATEGTDYDYATVSDITISAGATTGTATFNPTADTVNEGSEIAIIAISSVSGADSAKGSTTSVTITINEYALRTGTAFTEGTTSEQNTIKGRSSWTLVDQSSNTVHPYELLNLHKVHSFSSGGTSLTGVGQTIYISDSALHTNHDSFDGKTITMLDNPSASTTGTEHGTHVSSIAAGIVGEVTQGVAPDASLVFSSSADGATDRASDLDTARTSHSAIVANHSWGYCDVVINGNCYSMKTMTELESSASSAGRNIREELEAVYWGVTPTSTYITALDNFQNSGVIVFASGNTKSDTGVGFMGALPYYFNGTDDSVDLSDAWLSVMYAEFTGSSLSGASTSDFNRLGNPCGKAKEWCLVVDDRQIGAAGYVNSSGTSIWMVSGGSSMGAPQVSGGVALMAQAFPNHTPEQLVDRILASANNAWFDPDGNTTFTTHGNSITHGYHSTWGQGVPDFYAALSPITSNQNPMSLYMGESIQSSEAQTFASSSITPSASFGDAISLGLIGETGFAYDALSGGFKYDMATHVNTTNKEAPSINLSSELSKLDSQLSGVNSPSWKTNFDQVVSNLHKSDNQEVRLTLGASSLPVQSFFDFNSDSPDNFPDFNIPYLEAGEGGIGMGATYQLPSSRLLLGTTVPFEYNNGQIIGNRKTLAGSLEYGDPSIQSLTLMAGYTQDNNNLLGSTGTDAFSLAGSSSNTRFAALKARKQLNDDISLVGMATLANTDMTSPSNSFVNSASNVKSSSFSISANKKNLFGDDSITLNIRQPNLVSDGNLSIRLSNLADSNGNLSYYNKNINLRPSAKQLDYTVSYRKDLDEELGFSIKHLLTSNLNHNQDSDVFSSSYIGLKYKDLKLGFNINSFDFSKNTDLTYLHRF